MAVNVLLFTLEERQGVTNKEELLLDLSTDQRRDQGPFFSGYFLLETLAKRLSHTSLK